MWALGGLLGRVGWRAWGSRPYSCALGAHCRMVLDVRGMLVTCCTYGTGCVFRKANQGAPSTTYTPPPSPSGSCTVQLAMLTCWKGRPSSATVHPAATGRRWHTRRSTRQQQLGPLSWTRGRKDVYLTKTQLAPPVVGQRRAPGGSVGRARNVHGGQRPWPQEGRRRAGRQQQRHQHSGRGRARASGAKHVQNGVEASGRHQQQEVVQALGAGARGGARCMWIHLHSSPHAPRSSPTPAGGRHDA